MSKKNKIIIIIAIILALILFVWLLFSVVNKKTDKKEKEEAAVQALVDFKTITEAEKIFLDLPANVEVEVVERDELNNVTAYRVVGNDVLAPTIEDALKTADSDMDQILDIEEYKLGTDPYNFDTDNDGVPDFYEVSVYFSNPLVADSDSDGFTDGDEISRGYNPVGDGTLRQVQ